MVMARLHMICGNCGCNDEFEYLHDKNFVGPDDAQKQWQTTVICRNCATLHTLDDNAKNKNVRQDVHSHEHE